MGSWGQSLPKQSMQESGNSRLTTPNCAVIHMGRDSTHKRLFAKKLKKEKDSHGMTAGLQGWKGKFYFVQH